jgi:enamine deaminase RidA (YjgF/YER057c/UK114 family)
MRSSTGPSGRSGLRSGPADDAPQAPLYPSMHELINPNSLPEPKGFSHAVAAAPGRTIYLAGQGGHLPDGTLAGPGLPEQLDQALANVATTLRAAGAGPEHLVQIQLFVTDVQVYRSLLREAKEAWRRHLGPHYPAVALFEVSALFDPGAVIELLCVAVVPA